MDVEKVIREYIPKIIHMSLASASNNTPWISELHYAYDDKLNFYFRSLLSRRHSQEILKNPKVAGSIIIQHVIDQPLRGVYFEGLAKLVENEDELQIAYRCMADRFDLDEQVLQEAKQNEGHKFFKIRVDTFYVFDSIESTPGKKHQLNWKMVGE